MNLAKREEVSRIYELIVKGINAWLEAGELVANAVDDDPDFIDKFCDKHQDISPETMVRFELIGRKKLHPQTLIHDSPGMRRLRRLPFSLQEKYVSNPIPVIVKQEKGYDTLQVDVRNLTPEQALQVFESSGVRSESAQRAWIEDRLASRMAPAIDADRPYRITGRKVVVMQPCTLSARDVALIMADLER